MNGCTFTTGKIGSAFTFDGINDYVALPDNIFNFTGDFSSSAWFYSPSATYTHSGIVGNYNFATGTGWGIYTYQNRLYAQLGNVGGNYSTAYIDNSVVGSWNHVTMVFKKGTGFYLYMNGELKNSFTLTNNANAGISPAYSATQKAYIGLLNYSGDWWWMPNGGKIDAFNVWQRAISQDEITQLYNSGTGAQYPFTGTFSSAGNQLGMDNGTLMNGCYLSTGKVGQAFTFDGVNDYVSLPNNSLNFTGDFSVSLWLYRQALAGGMLVNNWYNGSTPFGWYVYNTNGVINFLLGNGTSSPVCNINSSLLTSNVWNFVTITKTETSAKIYINGVLNTSTTLSSSVVYTTTHYSMIGAAKYDTGSPSYYMENGSKLDAVNVWQKELTQAEVTELYNSGNGKQITATPIVQTGLVLNLDASRSSSYTGTGTTWTDISGNSLNGTLTNGPIFGTASGGSILFDGINDYVNISGLTTTNSFSISVWVDIDYNNSGTYARIIEKGLNNEFTLCINKIMASNKYTFQLGDGSIAVQSNSSISSGYKLINVTVENISSGNYRCKIYINGVLDNTSDKSITFSTNNLLYIGGRVDNQNICSMFGKISQTLIYNRTLSATEVLQNFNATKSRFGY